jgi:hypothetical protein
MDGRVEQSRKSRDKKINNINKHFKPEFFVFSKNSPSILRFDDFENKINV